MSPVNPHKYEITVRYSMSEWEEFNPLHGIPPVIERTVESGDGTRIVEPYDGGTHTVTEQKPMTRCIMQPKIAIYECADYRIEDGMLIMSDGIGSLDGFMVPLSVIQEVRVDSLNGRTRPNRGSV